MFNKPITALKKFFTFKQPGKKSKRLSEKGSLKLRSQAEILEEERQAKLKAKDSRKYFQRLVAQRKRVEKWRSKKGLKGMKT